MDLDTLFGATYAVEKEHEVLNWVFEKFPLGQRQKLKKKMGCESVNLLYLVQASVNMVMVLLGLQKTGNFLTN